MEPYFSPNFAVRSFVSGAIFSVNTIPTKIATWIAYSIITCVHNYTSTTSSLSFAATNLNLFNCSLLEILLKMNLLYIQMFHL